MAGKIVTSMPSDREIAMERSFTAPVELVFRAFGDADLIPKWWGFRTSTTVVEKLDFRPGGSWRFAQKSPDGEEWGFSGEFREIDPPRKIVQTFSYDPIPGYLVETVTFEQIGDQTKVTSVSLLDSKEARDGMAATGMEAGANETYDRLDELLETMKAGGA
jgi:uncharacterized protein YndB with AHSA1/START domain